MDPTKGAEINKTRPAVIVSSDAVGRLPIKLIVPVTGWKDYFVNNLWHIRLNPTKTNGLSKTSAANVLQLRGVDTRRIVKRIGVVSANTMIEVAAAIAAVVEHV